MKNYILSSKYQTLHFIGIGGVSMSALAKYAISVGKTVTGSEICPNSLTEELIKLGAKIYFKHSPFNLRKADAVVYTSAVKEDNVELATAKRKKIPIVKRSEFLGEILERFMRSVAISGSHGKTTATAMIASVLKNVERAPTVFLGGETDDYGNYLAGGEDFAVIEACEYKKNFLDITPDISVVLNIDDDHLDSYKDMADMVSAFSKFVGNSLAVINADDVYAHKIFNSSTVTFGINTPATYTAKSVKYNGKGYTFTACAHGRTLGKINLSVIGKHNVYNALATVAVCDVLRIPFNLIKSGLENFKGVKRRAEYLGEKEGLKFFADYAHHPRELKSTLKAFSESGDDFVTVFQPHTYSRTEKLIDAFISTFKSVKPLIIYKTYPAREEFSEKGDAETLYKNIISVSGENCIYAKNEEELLSAVLSFKGKFKKVVFFGAGDIYFIAKEFLEKQNDK
ncbi:MAG: UDP-N-acetylmuramate--L-alanine ligase [Clostridia bacterium]|nr:UDP-N-acetylmuramate--L-alanine ligase [Clostridia bacterium]